MNDLVERGNTGEKDIVSDVGDDYEAREELNEISEYYDDYSRDKVKSSAFEYKSIREKDTSETVAEKRERDIEELKTIKDELLNKIYFSDDDSESATEEQKVLKKRG